MLPKEKGGVVDAHLKVSTLLPPPADAKSFVDLYGFKVHGTKNLRVVDASIFPVAIAAHTQSTVYAVAEKVSYQSLPASSG